MPKTLKCDPKLFEKDLSGQVYIVTGANSGSGLETANQLAKQGAQVVAACRRTEAGEEAFKDLSVSGSVEVMKLDLASMDSVRSFAEAFKAKYDRLDGLANNAGMVCPEGKSEDGLGIQFAVNYLSHFLLTELLLDVLKVSSPARIVNVSSVVHAGNRNTVYELDFDDLDFTNRKYNSFAAYGESKLAMVMHASELARRLEGTGVTAYSVHPGWIRSNFGAEVIPGWARTAMNVGLRPFSSMMGMMSPFDGAQTSLHCLLDDSDVPQNNGAYYSQNSILYPKKENRAGGWPMTSPNPQAHDVAMADKLYNKSLELVGLS